MYICTYSTYYASVTTLSSLWVPAVWSLQKIVYLPVLLHLLLVPVLVVSLAYHVCWFEMSSNDGKKTRSFRSLSFRSFKNKKKKSSSDTVDGSTAPQHYRYSVSEFTNNNNFTSKSTPVCTVIATHSFTAILPCDLSFNQGDRIDVLTRTNTCFDWWEGRMNGRTGIFPANYVKVLD